METLGNLSVAGGLHTPQTKDIQPATAFTNEPCARSNDNKSIPATLAGVGGAQDCLQVLVKEVQLMPSVTISTSEEPGAF